MRKKFWVEPGFQLKSLLFVLSLVAITGAVIYLSLDRALLDVTQRSRWSLLHVEGARQILRWPFLWSLAFSLLGSGVLALFWFHRVVGPMEVFQKTLQRFAEGDFFHEIHLRETDQFQDLAADLKRAQEKLKERDLFVREKVNSAIALLKKRDSSERVLPILEEIKNHLPPLPG